MAEDKLKNSDIDYILAETSVIDSLPKRVASEDPSSIFPGIPVKVNPYFREGFWGIVDRDGNFWIYGKKKHPVINMKKGLKFVEPITAPETNYSSRRGLESLPTPPTVV